MTLYISPTGEIRCVYSEEIPVVRFGSCQIRRASHVEPTADGQWTADLSAVGGPLLGPFLTRSNALRAEVEWLEENLSKTF